MDAPQRRKRDGVLPAAHQPRGGARQPGGDLIAAVLLAAGGSRRFGRGNKLLAPLGPGGTMLDRSLATLHRLPVQRRLVVTGADRARVERRARGHAERLLHNPAWATGMASSVRMAVRALRPVDRTLVIMLADVPGTDPVTLPRLVRALAQGAWGARPGTPSHPGHPVILRRSAVQALALAGDRGLWRLLEEAAPERLVWCGGRPSASQDLDTVAALRAWRYRQREPRRPVRVSP